MQKLNTIQESGGPAFGGNKNLLESRRESHHLVNHSSKKAIEVYNAPVIRGRYKRVVNHFGKTGVFKTANNSIDTSLTDFAKINMDSANDDFNSTQQNADQNLNNHAMIGPEENMVMNSTISPQIQIQDGIELAAPNTEDGNRQGGNWKQTTYGERKGSRNEYNINDTLSKEEDQEQASQTMLVQNEEIGQKGLGLGNRKNLQKNYQMYFDQKLENQKVRRGLASNNAVTLLISQQ